MTQEDKELLLKDLCARLPYKPIVHIDNCGIWDLRGVDHDNSAELRDRVIVWHGENYPSSKNSFPIINCKPYLFPLSSMTEEQKEELKDEISKQTEILIERMKNDDCGIDCGKYHFHSTLEFDWLLKNHLDYRGLIEKGLAIDATGKNIY